MPVSVSSRFAISRDRVWFTSDTHYGHAAIINMCSRPFETVEEMDTKMIALWNDRVRNTDTVFHLGDFSFHKKEESRDILSKLKGKKILICGNHDSHTIQNFDEWTHVVSYQEIKIQNIPGISGSIPVNMFHYPIHSWNGSFRNSISLHGHSHGSTPGVARKDATSGRLDVGVDCWDFAPANIEEILARIEAIREGRETGLSPRRIQYDE